MLKILILMALVSCGSYESERIPNNPVLDKLRASKFSWFSQKQEFGGEYAYTTQGSASDAKHLRNWLTTIYVKEDRVVCRYFHQIDNLSVSVWFESLGQDTLGKHEAGAPLRTIDEMYDECGHLAMGDEKRRLFYAEDAVGVLASCYLPMEYPGFSKIQISSISGTVCAADLLMTQTKQE